MEGLRALAGNGQAPRPTTKPTQSAPAASHYRGVTGEGSRRESPVAVRSQRW